MRGSVLGMVMGLALAGLGCGGDDADGNAQFIGEWQFTSGNVNTKCPAAGVDRNDQLTGDKLRIAKGIDAPLIYSETDTTCVWKMSANGSVATISGGQSCTYTSDGSTVTSMYTAGTVSVTGTTAQFSGTLTSMVNIGGTVVNCSTTGSGGLSKITQ